MPLVLVVLAVAVTAGVVTGALVARWPSPDPTAPHLGAGTIRRELRLHPRLVRWLRRRPDPGATVSLLLVVTVAGVILAVAAVGVIMAMVWTDTGIARSDLPLAAWAAEEASPWSTDFLRTVSLLGGTSTVVLLSLVVAVVAVRKRPDWAAVGLLALTIGGQFGVVNVIKWIVDRARPDLSQLTGFAGPSFPSGHAAAAAACYACFALVLGRRRSRLTRVALSSGAMGIAASVAATRVLLGVHWFTDVVAGMLVGWMWFALCSAAFGGRLLHFGAPIETAEQMVDQGALEGAPTTDPVTVDGSASRGSG